MARQSPLLICLFCMASILAACSSGRDAASQDERVVATSTQLKPAQPGEKGCSKKIDCDDGNPCTDDSCIHGQGCQHTPIADGTACDDDNACTHTDACSGGLCVGTSAVSCTASDQCHAAGTCDPLTGHCTNPPAPDGLTCDDGNLCTRPDVCVAGACAGAPVSCAPLDGCHLAGSCDPSSGACSPSPLAPSGSACEDGDTCTTGDSCQAGVCQSGAGYACPPNSAGWLQLSAGAGVATAVWPEVSHASGYSIESDNPTAATTAAGCAGGVCGSQVVALDGTSHIAVAAQNAVGVSMTVAGAVVATPGAPSAIGALTPSVGQFEGMILVTLFWTGIADANTGYRAIEINPVTGAESVVRDTAIPSGSCNSSQGCLGMAPPRCDFECQWSLTSFLATGPHIIQVEPYDKQSSVASARSLPALVVVPAVDLTPPPVPTGLHVADIQKSSITLAWDKSPAADTSRYNVTALLGAQAVFSAATTCDAATCQEIIGGLFPGVNYTFLVAAVDTSGNESGDASVDGMPGTTGALSAPTVVLLAADDGMVHLRFTAPLTEGAARFHIWYRPASGGTESDAGFATSYDVAPTFCEFDSPLHCDTWITGLASIPYVIQLQSEGAPGNLSPRSDAQTFTPGPAAPNNTDSPDLCGLDLNAHTVQVTVAPETDVRWSLTGYFAPDVTSMRVTVHAWFAGASTPQEVVSSYDASSACNSDLTRCTMTVSYPSNADIGESSISVQSVDAGGLASELFGGPALLDGENRQCQ